MVTRCLRSILVTLSVCAVLLAAACEKVPLLAPTGSTITLSASTNSLSANGSTTIIAQVLEAAGTPPHSGTHVTFTTSLGRVDPSEAETDANGRAVATFIANGLNGMATITAISGGATTGSDGAVKIAVGTAAVAGVAVSANPQSVPASGGSSTISARILDINGNFLVGSPVTFTTTAGTLSTTIVTTDSSGIAATTLTTNQQATVTATVGVSSSGTGSGGTGTGGTGGTGTGGTGSSGSTSASSGSTTVNVTNGPTISITPPATVTKGTPASFTITTAVGATNGAPIRSVTINWGDGGGTRDLGAITGASSQSHQYNQDGPFTISATVTDTAGSTASTSTSIDVLPAPQPTVAIGVPATVTANVPASFTFTTAASSSNAAIRTLAVNWGDGQSDSFGASAGASTQSHTYETAGRYVISATVTDANGSSGNASSSINVIASTPPAITLTPSASTVNVGTPVTFSITATPLNGLTIRSITIDYGDGNIDSLGTASPQSVQHSYTSAGAKQVTVTVVDSNNQVGTTQRTIIVN
jgi:PKD repeat protein